MLEVRHTRIFVAVALLVVYSTQLCGFGISNKLSVYLLCSCFVCLLTFFLDKYKMTLCKVYCSIVM